MNKSDRDKLRERANAMRGSNHWSVISDLLDALDEAERKLAECQRGLINPLKGYSIRKEGEHSYVVEKP